MKHGRGEVRSRGLKFFIAWLFVFALLAPNILSFKKLGLVNILGYESQGQGAIMTLTLLTAASVVLLALGLRDLARYRLDSKRDDEQR